jgi:hypothetical protein
MKQGTSRIPWNVHITKSSIYNQVCIIWVWSHDFIWALWLILGWPESSILNIMILILDCGVNQKIEYERIMCIYMHAENQGWCFMCFCYISHVFFIPQFGMHKTKHIKNRENTIIKQTLLYAVLIWPKPSFSSHDFRHSRTKVNEILNKKICTKEIQDH